MSITHTWEQRQLELAAARNWVAQIRNQVSRHALNNDVTAATEARAELLTALTSEANAAALLADWPAGSTASR